MKKFWDRIISAYEFSPRNIATNDAASTATELWVCMTLKSGEPKADNVEIV